MRYPTDEDLMTHYIQLLKQVGDTTLDRNEWNILKTYNEIILRMGSSN